MGIMLIEVRDCRLRLKDSCSLLESVDLVNTFDVPSDEHIEMICFLAL